ncbi:hypothetical protein [Vibrio cyclitrophicus]|uniref:Uncharacterized protein n=1 Tax=Vibrio tasmaniensis TaxID=212663 RepID=A0A0H3ZSJ2_9VIBR|nr:hypothetical protein [Vibrio cyclitrophicus]AKN36854.1 hypothetical protein [Vibrio tasmaniensis]OEF27139.1 hypothetical protein OA9_14825 [Vibrio cyclitrophicus 1F97]
MKHLEIKEIITLFDAGALKSAKLVSDFNDAWLVVFSGKGEDYSLVTQRGDHKRYKSPESAMKELYSIGFKEFTVSIASKPFKW